MNKAALALIGTSLFLAAGAAHAAFDSTAGANSDGVSSTRGTQPRMEAESPNATSGSPSAGRSTATGISPSTGVPAGSEASRSARTLSDAPNDYTMKAQARLDEIEAWLSKARPSGDVNTLGKLEERSKELRAELDGLRTAKASDWRRGQAQFETAMQDLERDFTKAQISVN